MAVQEDATVRSLRDAERWVRIVVRRATGVERWMRARISIELRKYQVQGRGACVNSHASRNGHAYLRVTRLTDDSVEHGERADHRSVTAAFLAVDSRQKAVCQHPGRIQYHNKTYPQAFSASSM